MNDSKKVNYDRIAEAIRYIKDNFKVQPNLENVAAELHLSPFHFQRLFTQWAGTSPKKFLQFISLKHAKKLLKESRMSLFDAAYEIGLSGTSRLHDLFITIEGMSPAEYKNGGMNLSINYSIAESTFGNIIVASTEKGICHMSFYDDEGTATGILFSKFPNASFHHKLDLLQQNALFIFQHDWSKLHQIKLHLKGTDFQLKVWETLLKIPMGNVLAYKDIAEKINKPDAQRAVGTAIGNNPIAFLIPCHRVIQADGNLGSYKWGEARKSAMIGWESSRVNEVQ